MKPKLYAKLEVTIVMVTRDVLRGEVYEETHGAVVEFLQQLELDMSQVLSYRFTEQRFCVVNGVTYHTDPMSTGNVFIRDNVRLFTPNDIGYKDGQLDQGFANAMGFGPHRVMVKREIEDPRPLVSNEQVVTQEGEVLYGNPNLSFS